MALLALALGASLAVAPDAGAARHHRHLHPRHAFQVGALNMLNAMSHPLASKRVGGCRHRGDSESCIMKRTKRQARIILGGRHRRSSLSVVSLEEVSSPQYAALKKLLPGYGFFPRHVGDYHGVAITWNTKRFRLLGHGRLGSVYNNVGTLDDPAFPWVRLRSTSGRVVDVLAVHSTAKSYRHSLRMQEHNAKRIRRWARLHQRHGRTAIVAGDFNNNLADPGRRRRHRGHAGPTSPYCMLSSQGWLTSAGDLLRQVRPGQACAGHKRTHIWLDQVYASHTALVVTRWVNVGPRSQRAPHSPSGTDHGPVIARITPYY